MERFQQVFASFAPPFASLARLESIVPQGSCFICTICFTCTSYVRRVMYNYLYLLSLAYDIIDMHQMNQMEQNIVQAVVFINESFCFTFEVVKQVKQKPFVLLERVGLSWI